MKQVIKVSLPYSDGKDGSTPWNEVCAWVIENYGMPGEKYVWHPENQKMVFDFYDEQDAIHVMLRWL